MIKTLKITSILVAIVAVGLLAFVVSKGFKGDEAMEKRLLEIGIAETMKESGSARRIDTSQDSPLVRQAKAFALRINPPAPVVKQPRRTASRKVALPRPKAAVSAKFKLLGTSYYPDDEKNSWALVSEVGKGMYWVKYGDSIGHLKIEKIGAGAILIKDGGNTYEMVVEEVKKPNYVQSYTGPNPETIEKITWGAIRKGEVTAIISPVETPQDPSLQELPSDQAQAVSEDSIKSNIEWLKKLQNNPDEMGLSDEEAAGIEGLGDLLKSLESSLEIVQSPDVNESNSTTPTPKPTTRIGRTRSRVPTSEDTRARPLPEALLKRKK